MRRPVRFDEVEALDVEPVTKLWGHPIWLEEPQWLISRTLARPVFFLGGLRLDGGPGGEPRLGTCS